MGFTSLLYVIIFCILNENPVDHWFFYVRKAGGFPPVLPLALFSNSMGTDMDTGNKGKDKGKDTHMAGREHFLSAALQGMENRIQILGGRNQIPGGQTQILDVQIQSAFDLHEVQCPDDTQNVDDSSAFSSHLSLFLK
jgi:hypothetical protein